MNKSWQQDINDTTVFFEEQHIRDEDYLFSALAKTSKAKLACHAFTDEIVINQCEYHLKDDDNGEEFLELLATLIATVRQAIPEYEKYIEEEYDKMVKARNTYADKY